MINKFGQYYKRKPIKRELRLAVYERDNFTCHYCGLHANEDELQIDHIIPVSRGGTNDFSNLVTSCSKCNKKKGARCEQDRQAPDALAEALHTTVAYLSDETDNPQRETNDEEKISLPVVRDRTVIKDPSFVKEGNLIGNKNVLVYEVNGERFILPATKENQSWFRNFMMTAMSARAVAPA